MLLHFLLLLQTLSSCVSDLRYGDLAISRTARVEWQGILDLLYTVFSIAGNRTTVRERKTMFWSVGLLNGSCAAACGPTVHPAG